MIIKQGFLFVHVKYGLCIVTDVDGDYLSAYSIIAKRNYTFSRQFIENNYDYSLVEKNYKSIKQLILDDAFETMFDPATKARATSYYRGQELIKISKVENDLIEAEVFGTSKYRVSIFYNEGVVYFNCTCPVFSYCKHLYALIKKVATNTYFMSDKETLLDAEVLDEEELNDLEKSFNITDRITFDNLDKIEALREKLYATSAKDIVAYFNSHLTVTSLTKRLGYVLCFVDDNLFEKISFELSSNYKYEIKSDFLRNLAELRKPYIKSNEVRNRYRVYEDSYKIIFGFIINSKFNEALEYINSYNFTNSPSMEALIGYYLEGFYKNAVNYLSVLDLFIDQTNIYQTFLRIKDDNLKQVFYVTFQQILVKFGVKPFPVNAYSKFISYKSLVSATTNKQKTKIYARSIVNLASELIKEGHEEELLQYILSNMNSYYSTFTYEDYYDVAMQMPDNYFLINLLRR